MLLYLISIVIPVTLLGTRTLTHRHPHTQNAHARSNAYAHTKVKFDTQTRRIPSLLWEILS